MSPGSVANVYFGTSPFAATVLERLAGSPHRPNLVVTPPDRPQGRGRTVSPPPVAEAARQLGIELLQVERVNDAEAVERIRAAGAAAGTVCAFGQLIGADLLALFPLLNVHPSLLPRWRGAAPIERAIMAGDEETGVAVIRLTEGLDSGPIALLERSPIGDQETFGDLAPRLAEIGAGLLVKALDLHAAGELRFTEQADQGATYAEKIASSERRLDPFRETAVELSRRRRALHPQIGAFVELSGGGRLRVTAARPLADPQIEPGRLEAGSGDRLLLGCREGALEILELQPDGGRPMPSADFIRGHGLPTVATAGETP